MKKVLLGAVGVVAVAIVGFVAAVSMQAPHTHIERSVTVAASPADVFPYLENYQHLHAWSPWSALDPDQKTTFSDPPTGKEAWYTWDGNDDVGAGKLTTTEHVENKKVTQKLEFTRPFEAQAVVGLAVVPEGEGSKVTWSYDADNDFMGKMGLLFVDMETMLGGDYEKGLTNLKPMVEKAAADRLAAEKKAEEEARMAAEAAEAEEGTEGGAGSEG